MEARDEMHNDVGNSILATREKLAQEKLTSTKKDQQLFLMQKSN